MADLSFELVDEPTFDDIPDPAQPGARCQTCDYWERLDGGRAAPAEDASDADARTALKRRRLLAGQSVSGSYAMLARRAGAPGHGAVGYAQFGPLSAYPRAQSIRDRYPQLPESPAPWVITCLQVISSEADRMATGVALLEAVCAELDGRGITAVESYPEQVGDAWRPSAGPSPMYEAASFEQAVDDDRYPVYRRELTGETDADAWAGLLRAAEPDDSDDWPLPLPSGPDEDAFFRLPPERKRPNPFGDD